jgi:hypothetical protein
MAAVCAEQDLSKEDQIDEQAFSQAIWQSVKGPDSQLPAPKYALFGTGGAGPQDNDDRPYRCRVGPPSGGPRFVGPHP